MKDKDINNLERAS